MRDLAVRKLEKKNAASIELDVVEIFHKDGEILISLKPLWKNQRSVFTKINQKYSLVFQFIVDIALAPSSSIYDVFDRCTCCTFLFLPINWN